VASTFRAALEGTVLFEFSDGDEDIRLRFSVVNAAKSDIERVLDLPVENRQNYLVPLRNIVTVREVVSPTSIARYDLKRTSLIDADMQESATMTPLQVAQYFEREVFPAITAKAPTTSLVFAGEVLDTRESARDFENAIGMVLILIYAILAILFNSLTRPLVIMLAIPFGVVGVILAFALHGKLVFGFYAAVGALGLAGVVINDAIIMLAKLDSAFVDHDRPGERHRRTAKIASTRSRAVVLTTLTTVAGVLPTAYGFAGYDAMLAEMMLALAWGMVFGTLITLVLIPCVFGLEKDCRHWRRRGGGRGGVDDPWRPHGIIRGGDERECDFADRRLCAHGHQQ
ncbi:MAG: efflux RND transporter permease subunit, partial [Verrucomicrobia bacterium]|nr:efflux RND transporter permease subunit [Verrucomicrobiota bacterium]